MKDYALAEHLYLHPTPGGAYHAVTTKAHTPAKQLIRNLLQMESSPALTLAGLKDWSAIEDAERAYAMLHHAQEAKWLQGLKAPLKCPNQPLSEILPELLSQLSSQAKVLLADSQGFYLATHGFPHEVAEELSALSADLANLHERRSGLLLNNLGLNSSAWSVVDSAGNSKVGFWPLYLGKERFVLVAAGMPRFNQPDFVTLVWILSRRYAGVGS
ncbi:MULTISPECIES: hypothetical protein [Methylocaldum]|jgi:hypothetical protein|uniref:hypothetical protein n=1 Tax=unclassified Methylocaldum TaxID=2622260 RepID=UPI000989B030|nr:MULTISPECIES: hypothetical protein [unclassified Methylocaldum]MBP1149223.1 hypothetical protein [Methylocaldum sp. RMAD-M]MVF21440.1 hypothetical protein [Methylocaldum sp. BRCS4]